MGWFGPTELGERLMPALTFLGPYHERISRAMVDGLLPTGQPIAPSERKLLAREALTYKMTPEASAALDALALELRDAAGHVVATRHISVQDTEYLLALGGGDVDDWDVPEFSDDDILESEADEFSSALIELGIEEEPIAPDASLVPEAWMPERDESWGSSTLPRYQIYVELHDGRSIPVADRWKDDPYVQSLVAGHDPFATFRDEDAIADGD
jgi:hypothetical protein